MTLACQLPTVFPVLQAFLSLRGLSIPQRAPTKKDNKGGLDHSKVPADRRSSPLENEKHLCQLRSCPLCSLWTLWEIKAFKAVWSACPVKFLSRGIRRLFHWGVMGDYFTGVNLVKPNPCRNNLRPSEVKSLPLLRAVSYMLSADWTISTASTIFTIFTIFTISTISTILTTVTFQLRATSLQLLCTNLGMVNFGWF